MANIYRRAKAKQHPKTSFARSLYCYLLYILRTSSIHGLAHVGTESPRHPLERVVWVLCVGLGLYGATKISYVTWRHYQDTPTVISMERDYKAWNTTFPAITICFEEKVDSDRLESVTRKLALQYNFTDASTVREFVRKLAECSYEDLDNVPDIRNIPASQYLDIVLEVSPQLNLSVTSINAEANNVNPNLIPNFTERGLCYSFNSLAAIYVSPMYWKTGEVPKGTESLSVVEVNPLDGDASAQLIHLPGAYRLFVHGPGEVPDFLSPSVRSPPSQFKTLVVSALSVHTTAEAASLRPEQRRCRFLHEPDPAIGSPVYTYNLCRRRCRALLVKSLCECVPHFYGPTGDGETTCDAKGLQCVAEFAESFIRLIHPLNNKRIRCDCLQPCDDVTFTFEEDNNAPWFLGTDLKWGISKYPRMRMRRDVIFGFTDVLVSVGSTAGLFLGCSVLSFIELLYFWTLRLYWFLKRDVRQRQDTPNSGQTDYPEPVRDAPHVVWMP